MSLESDRELGEKRDRQLKKQELRNLSWEYLLKDDESLVRYFTDLGVLVHGDLYKENDSLEDKAAAIRRCEDTMIKIKPFFQGRLIYFYLLTQVPEGKVIKWLLKSASMINILEGPNNTHYIGLHDNGFSLEEHVAIAYMAIDGWVPPDVYKSTSKRGVLVKKSVHKQLIKLIKKQPNEIEE